MKLGLGTVQFGGDYGISNQEGQTSPEEAARVLELARERGISLIDTAPLYGSSELVLGRLLQAGLPFKVVTKTARIDAANITPADANSIERTFLASLERLRSPSVYGLLIHNADDLLSPGGEFLFVRMLSLRQRGLVEKIGVSVYTPDQVDRVLDRFPIDLVQLPVNVLDQRLVAGGQLARLKEEGVEVHARSAFLQGVLLMDPAGLPRHFDPVRQTLVAYHDYLSREGLSATQGALAFVAALREIDVVVCGVNHSRHLAELCDAAGVSTPLDFSRFACNDPSILNPSLWKLGR